MNLRAITLAAALVLIGSSAGGCYRQIVYTGTGAYEKRAATLAVTPARAAELAAAAHDEREKHEVASRAETKRIRWPKPKPTATALVKRAFLFETPVGREKFKCLPLTGFYVNGDDGTVTFRRGHCLPAGDWTGRMPTEVPEWAWHND